MTILEANKLEIGFGFGPVLQGLSFVVAEGDRVSIVGQNGCGKSTLLRILSGEEKPDDGVVSIKKGTKIAYLKQTVPDDVDAREVTEILREEFFELDARAKVLIDLEQEMNTCTDHEALDALVHRYSRLTESFMNDGGYDIENTIAYVTNGLKIPDRILKQNYMTLSGGEKTLVHFAKILLSKPDLLLLDEPTNHLDIERVEWLEGYLSKLKGTVIIVSHDRYFLDKVSKKVFEIENKTGTMYHGNYTSYVKQKEENELKAFNEYKNEQRKISAMEEAVKKLKEWGERGDNPTLFRRAKAIEKKLDEMRETATEKPRTTNALPISFISSGRASNDAIVLKDFSLLIGDHILLENANASIHFYDKVALVGANGSGKTTLIKTLLGEYDGYLGTKKLGTNLHIGYLPQILMFENSKESVLDYFHYLTGHNEADSRKLLAKFQFYQNDVFKSVGSLSGGEKIRIKLAVLLQKQVNMLVFDEPTNHIDISTREVLEETLKQFAGPVLFVSHDRYFINNLANKVIEIANQKLNTFDGNYDDYKRALTPKVVLEEIKPIKPTPPKKKKK